jgi:hypothetical protein
VVLAIIPVAQAHPYRAMVVLRGSVTTEVSSMLVVVLLRRYLPIHGMSVSQWVTEAMKVPHHRRAQQAHKLALRSLLRVAILYETEHVPHLSRAMLSVAVQLPMVSIPI